MKTLSLAPLAFSFFLISSLSAQQLITGNVLGDDGIPLIGATIQVQGTAQGTITGLQGEFQLSLTERAGTVLVVSYLGYESQEVLLGEEEQVEVVLSLDRLKLSEVVVVGYGTQTRRRITSSIASLDSDAFEGLPAPNFQVALEGRLPGVVVNQSSGAMNSESVIRVRGPASINANNQALVVVDGLILNDIGPGLPLNALVNPYININPNDIESVEILKDAAASSIYGSRGANGVILITTRRGRFNQAPQVTLSGQAGFSEAGNRYDLLNGKEYAQLWNRAAAAIGMPEATGLYYDVESQPSTDWFDLLTRRGFVQEYQASVQGGTETARYYISGSFRNEESYFKYSGSQRYSFRANIDQQLSDHFQVGLSIAPSQTTTQRTGESSNFRSPNTQSGYFFPNIDAFDENGEPVGGIVYTSIGMTRGAGTPLVNTKETDFEQSFLQLLLNAYLSYRPFPALELRMELGADVNRSEEHLKASSRTNLGYGIDGYGIEHNEQINGNNWTTQATYHPYTGRHDLQATLGVNLTFTSYTGQTVEGGGYADDRLNYLEAASNILYGGGWKDEHAFTGYFGRVDYSFQRRYLLTLSGRYDGSSRFGENNRFGFFPAVSAGWILSEESFWSSGKINFLKLRSSFGLTGNAEIGNYASKGQISFQADYNGEPGFRAASLENRELGWEQTQQWDAALEVGLFNNRLRATLGYYIKNTKDMLLNAPIPATSGFSILTRNVGSMQNRGFEFDLSVDVFTGRAASWTLSINGATLHNKITSLVDNDNDGQDDDIIPGYPGIIYRTGENVSSIYLIRYAGVDPATGDALFYDLEGNPGADIPIDANEVLVGHGLPSFTGGLTSTLQIKGFDFQFHFKFATGHHRLRGEGVSIENNMSGLNNQLRSQLDAWTPENPDTDVPEARLFTVNGNQPSTRYLDAGDYLRLKNLQLGYTFQGIGKKRGRLRLYISGQNLLTVTSYTGLDPEVGLGIGAPAAGSVSLYTSGLPRTILFGVNLHL